MRQTPAQSSPVSRQQARQVAGHLLDSVLGETLTARQALNRWPLPPGRDESVDVAATALLYFEADEDRHRQELFYVDAQLALLEQMRQILTEGRALPDYMCRAYQGDHRSGFLDDGWLWRRPFMAGWQMICRGWDLCRQALCLSTIQTDLRPRIQASMTASWDKARTRLNQSLK